MGDSSSVLLMIMVVFLSSTPIMVMGDDLQSRMVIGPHCSDKCGNISIPYPFGIEEGCYYDDQHNNNSIHSKFSSFKIHCNPSNSSTGSPTPIFGTNLEVLKISVLEGELRSKWNVSYNYYYYNKSRFYNHYRWESINLVSFTLSSTKNVLVAIGCDTYAWFYGFGGGKIYQTGCMSICTTDIEDVIDGECTGVGCCQASIADGVHDVIPNWTKLDPNNNHSYVYRFNPCSVAFPVARDAFRFNITYLNRNLEYYADLEVPVVFSWTIGQDNCSVAKANGSCLCKENAVCIDPEHELGYRCICKQGYSGNPYLPRGCRDIDECKGKNDCEKAKYCINTVGSYYCKCPRHYHGNGTASDPCISNRKPWLTPVLATAGIGGGIITFLMIGFLLHFIHGKRKIRIMRESFFRQNGGFLLHEKLSGRADTLKIFTMQDLEVACNNYSDTNIIGRGGFGIVYKGFLPDNQVVAIKKSLKVDPSQVDQFINEVVVLSQINNKNIVRLIGCCLESGVPLLVYEFINNGTLYDHLHDAMKASILKWPLRLKIASEVANVLSYLHNTISTTIIHRDMKSMNILLDESYTAKVTDFGASRLVPPEQSQFATMVLGTRGYLDPEYLQTSEVTEKSDVYSFGVVLVELLTRKKAISTARPEAEKCLAMHFLLKLREGHLSDIPDMNIVSEGTIEAIQQMANLAKWCLMLKGEERPTMKEVAMELETIRKRSHGSHPWNDDGSVKKDCESLLGEIQRSDEYGGCSSGIESNSYDSHLLSSLRSGR
ncbi:wall-associated receptor kinase 2-like [Chenopodium quinoa]|nr:wall-associated receptor kinase 2-like [Chenopodium quinoa]